MKKIPVRCIKKEESNDATVMNGFHIHNLETLLGGVSMQQKTHRHSFYFILLIESGSGEHVIDLTPYSVSKYNIYFLKPGQVHSLYLSADCKGYMLQFTEAVFQPRKFKIPNSQQLEEATFNEVKAIVSKIESEYLKQLKGYKSVIISCIEILLIELSRYSVNSITQPNQYNQQRLDEFLELIETHFKEEKTVAFFAKTMRLTSYQLNAITKELLNKTPSILINEHIILEAKRQLLTTSNQVKQIADLLGYEDTSYFIRFFKKHTSFSPEVFRKNFE